MNSVNIMGRLVNEPELKFTKNQKAVVTIRIAVDSGYADQSGNRQTCFFDVVAWDGTAQFISTWFTKGQMIALSGKLQTRSWTDRFEQKRVSVEIVAQNVYFCGERKASSVGSTDATVRAEPPSSVSAHGTATFPQGEGFGNEKAEQMRWNPPAAYGSSPPFDKGGYNNDFRPLEGDDDVPF